jgi:PepSY-associated transmembrane protein
MLRLNLSSCILVAFISCSRFNQLTGIYRVSFFLPGAERENGLEPKALYIDGNSGAILGESVPWVGTFADVFMQLQFPLHSGRIAGLSGRIFLSLMGVVVATLSFTGIVIWFKKRLARRSRAELSHSPNQPASLRVVGSFMRGLVDEDRLRLRFSGISQTTHGISETRGPLPLAHIVMLVGPLGVIILSAGSIAAQKAYRAMVHSVRIASIPARELIVVFLSKSFWEAALWDARAYARRLQAFLGRVLKHR